MSRAPLADHRQSEQEETHQPRAQVRRDEDYQLLLASRLGDNGVEEPQGARRHGQAEAQKGKPERLVLHGSVRATDAKGDVSVPERSRDRRQDERKRVRRLGAELLAEDEVEESVEHVECSAHTGKDGKLHEDRPSTCHRAGRGLSAHPRRHRTLVKRGTRPRSPTKATTRCWISGHGMADILPERALTGMSGCTDRR